MLYTNISIFIVNKMKFKPYTGISWSLLELAGLLEDEDSHVHYGKIKKHLGLHPFHLTNLSVALNEILRSNLNSYDSELQGFLLAYKNPKLLTALGDTFYDSCFIHVDIEADFYVFRPEVGHEMKGIVNKKGYNHIGVLVHKAFNVYIPKTVDATEWPGDLIEIGQEVKVTITHIDHTSKLPFIRGSINRANYLEGCKLLTKITKKRKKTTKNASFFDRNNESDNSCDSDVEKHETVGQSKLLKELEKQVSSEKSSKKKRRLDDGDIQDGENKKHSKKRLRISQELNHSECGIGNGASYESSNDNANIVNNTDIDTSAKKKKRSEKSSKKKSLEGSQISEPEFDCSTMRIKVEKDLTSNSDSENTTGIELKKREKKSKRQSKKMKYSGSPDCSIDNEEIQKDVKLEHKRHSKKHKLPDSDINDSRIEIKVERSPKSNNITEYPLDKNNHDTVSHRRKSSEKDIKMSVTDSESEIGNIRIKEEKNTIESEHTQGEDDRKDKISKIVKTEKFANKSFHSINDTENENYPNGLPTKHKRKREKTPVVEEDFENVTIKEEKSDDYSSNYTSQSNKSLKNRHIDNVNDNVNHEYDIRLPSNGKKSPKKSKEINIKSDPEEIVIKVEKEKIKNEFEDKGDSRVRGGIEEKGHKTSPKKHSTNESFKNYQSDNSTTEDSEGTKHKISSPRKRLKKSREPKYEILSGNVRVKIERSSSVESYKI